MCPGYTWLQGKGGNAENILNFRGGPSVFHSEFYSYMCRLVVLFLSH